MIYFETEVTRVKQLDARNLSYISNNFAIISKKGYGCHKLKKRNIIFIYNVVITTFYLYIW